MISDCTGGRKRCSSILPFRTITKKISMIKKLNDTVTLKDSKGKEYKFEMYSYDTID